MGNFTFRVWPLLVEMGLQNGVSTQDSFVFTVVFCTLSFINLIRVAYVVRRPCSDFTDMLRRYINCGIIIIIIIIIIVRFCFILHKEQ